MTIHFTEKETIELLMKMPEYSHIVSQASGVDILALLGVKSPKEIVTLILEGGKYEH